MSPTIFCTRLHQSTELSSLKINYAQTRNNSWNFTSDRSCCTVFGFRLWCNAQMMHCTYADATLSESLTSRRPLFLLWEKRLLLFRPSLCRLYFSYILTYTHIHQSWLSIITVVSEYNIISWGNVCRIFHHLWEPFTAIPCFLWGVHFVPYNSNTCKNQAFLLITEPKIRSSHPCSMYAQHVWCMRAYSYLCRPDAEVTMAY